MSGVEALGAIASSAQIAVYLVKAATFLSEIYERVKHAPDRIRQHASEIEKFLEIVRHIQQGHKQNSILLFEQLESTVLQACSVRDLLEKTLRQYTHPSLRTRYWKLLKGNKEKRILAALQSLEREKTGLSLCLTASNTDLLHEVRLDLKRGEGRMDNQQIPSIPFEEPPSPPASCTEDEATSQMAASEESPKRRLAEARSLISPKNPETFHVTAQSEVTTKEGEIQHIEGTSMPTKFYQAGKRILQVDNNDMNNSEGFQNTGVMGLQYLDPDEIRIVNRNGKNGKAGFQNNGVLGEGCEKILAMWAPKK